VSGDRPSSKSTPFVLRLVTPDLVPVPTDSYSAGPVHYCIQKALEGAETVTMQLAELAEELFSASILGDWTSITKAETNLPPAYSIISSPAPQIFIMPPETKEPPQPRVGTARMSASPPGRQSHLTQPRGRSPGPIPDQALVTQTIQPTVSVLADGFSVKAVTSAWSNITSTKLGMQVAQARAKSPGWTHAVASVSVSQHRQRQSSVRRRTTESAFETSPTQSQVIDRAARVRERIHRSQARAPSRDHSVSKSH